MTLHANRLNWHCLIAMAVRWFVADDPLSGATGMARIRNVLAPVPGKPLQVIPALAGQLRVDLLVIGKSPERRLFSDLRTLSYEIACRTPCPVASV